MLTKINLGEAVGMVLAHDITKVIPGVFKGLAFRRGHVVTEEDVPELLKLGKEHLYVMNLEINEIHEDDAARRLGRAIAGPGLELTEPKEGRVNLKAEYSGLLKVDVDLLREVNSFDEAIVSTLHDQTICQVGTLVAGTRTMHLTISDSLLRRIERMCRDKGGVVRLLPLKMKRVGAIITGNEVYKGRIKDGFADVIRRKVMTLGSVLERVTIVPDDADIIGQYIIEFIESGVEVIVVCGGMSKDPDDCTCEGVRRSGAEIVIYGAPVLPGSMFLHAVCNGIPIIGVPACVLHSPTTILDIILPRVLTDQRVSREEIIELGHGGLCLGCSTCYFPSCPFGK